jgi:hypothetical protein
MLTGFFVRWSIRLSFANAFTKIKAALSQDKSPLARNIMKGIIESEQIVKSKMGNAALVGDSSVTSSKEKKVRIGSKGIVITVSSPFIRGNKFYSILAYRR